MYSGTGTLERNICFNQSLTTDFKVIPVTVPVLYTTGLIFFSLLIWIRDPESTAQ
jgi:hypothetical protein